MKHDSLRALALLSRPDRLLGGITTHFMAPIWPQGQAAQVGVETSYPADNWASVYVPPNFDSSTENSYHLEWNEESISWTINDVEIVRYVRGSGPWISGPLVSFQI